MTFRRVAVSLVVLLGCFDIKSKVGGQAGAVSVSPDAIDFGGTGCEVKAKDELVTIVNAQDVALSWTASLGKGNASAYRLRQPSGQVAAGTAAQLAVSSTTGVAADAYDDTLTITTDAP